MSAHLTLVSSAIGYGPTDWTLQDGVTAGLHRAFTEGLCGYLALALHRRTGWALRGEVNGDCGNHVWVVDPNGKAVDISGYHRTGYARFPGGPKLGARHVVALHAEELAQAIPDDSAQAWADRVADLLPILLASPVPKHAFSTPVG